MRGVVTGETAGRDSKYPGCYTLHRERADQLPERRSRWPLADRARHRLS